MARSENKGTLDKRLIVRALNAFKNFYGKEQCIIPPYLYDQAIQQGINLKGFTRRCQRKDKHGNGALKLVEGSQKRRRGRPRKYLLKPEVENTKQMIDVSKNASIGCIADASKMEGNVTSLEQKQDSIFSVRS